MNETLNVFEIVADGMTDGIVLIDRDYKVIFSNAAVNRLFGVGKNNGHLTCHYLFHRLSSPCNHKYEFKHCPHHEVLKTGRTVSARYPYILKSGQKRIFDITASPVRDKTDSGVTCIVKILKDITDKSRTEIMPMDAEIKYQNLVENALVGVYKCTTKGRILYANKALAVMLEFKSSEEMINRSVILRYKDPEQREVLVGSLMEKGSVCNYEVTLLTRTGNMKHLLLSANLEGDVMSCMIMDISVQKKSDEGTGNKGGFFSLKTRKDAGPNSRHRP